MGRLGVLIGKKPRNLWVALTTFLIIFIYLNCVNNKVFVYDSSYYNELSDTFVSTGEFSLSSFPITFRGVIFPLLLFGFKFIVMPFSSEPYLAWRLMISLMISLLSIAFPYLFQNMRRKNMGWLEYMVPIFLIMFFWHGLLNYALSDFVAVCFLIFGMATLIYAFSFKNTSNLKVGLLSFLSGIFMYAAYNIRTVYLFSLLFFVPAVLITNLLNRALRFKIFTICTLCLLAGICALGCLEGYVNHYRFGIDSIKVQADVGGMGLYMFQLKNGLLFSQYETYILLEEGKLVGAGGLHFQDPVGIKLFQEGDFFSFIIHHPFEVIGIYTRHFVNMLNPVWGGGSYITNLNAFKLHRSVLNYVILFLSVKQLYITFRGKSFKQVFALIGPHINSILAIFAMLGSCVVIMFGAVEIRFFLPMYLVLYGYLSYCTDFRILWNDIKKKPVLNAVCFSAVFLILCGFWASTYTLSDSPVPLSVF